MRFQHVLELVKSTVFLFYKHEAKRFQPLFLLSFFSFATLSIFHRRTKSLFKEVRKRRFNSVFKLNQLLNRVLACILYFAFIVPHRKISWLELQKKYKNVDSNGEEA